MAPLTVYVPRPGTYAAQRIAKGSGIVGVPAGDEVLIHYEGNLYGAQNIRTFEDKLLHAADRLLTNYPTSAKMQVPETDLEAVGTYDLPTRTFLTAPLRDRIVADWTDPRPPNAPEGDAP